MTRREILLGSDDAERLAIGKTLDAYDVAKGSMTAFRRAINRTDTAERRVAAENLRRSVWYFEQAQEYLEAARRSLDSTTDRKLNQEERMLF